MRKKAREICFKVIYKSLFMENDYSYGEIVVEENLADEDVAFIDQMINLFKENKNEIDEKINAKLVGYKPERVFSIDRAILDLAVTEIFYYKETPIPVVINEAVELSKVYSTSKSASFVNGILRSLTSN